MLNKPCDLNWDLILITNYLYYALGWVFGSQTPHRVAATEEHPEIMPMYNEKQNQSKSKVK